MNEHSPVPLPAGSALITLAEAIARFIPGETYHPWVWVQGEISDLRRARSGHRYFTLHDGSTTIPCVLWERVARGISVHPKDGLEVAVTGWIQRCPKAQHHLELDVRDLVLRNPQGPRQRAVQELTAKLRAKGLLDPTRKRRLPESPTCIGIVTSPAGDVIHDVRRVLERRAPGIRIQVAPTRVTGEGAAAEIAAAIQSLSDADTASLIIVARGGGSASDLAAYDSEMVARAIAACCVPVITAIGHEPDVTIADRVADMRCATPSEAAEIAVPERAVAGSSAQENVGDAVTELRLQVGPASVLIRCPAPSSDPIRKP